MTTGWVPTGNPPVWYYLTGSGDMVTGWKQLSGSWYYFDASGAMLADTSRELGGKTYYFSSSGACFNP